MSVTIREVARAAGVSVATVSRVLNDSGPVHPQTRRRVEAAARALRYTPNSAARSLIMRRTKSLGVVLPDLYGEFFSELMRGIDQAAQAEGFHILLSSSHSAPEDIEAALQAMRGRVDGLLLMAPEVDTRTLQTHLPESLPLLLLNCPVGDADFDSLSVDNYGGAYAMTAHLLALGHRRIAFLCGPENNHDASERLRAYRAAMQALGGEWSPELELPGDFVDASGYAAAERALALAPRPTALQAANDAMAIAALGALREAGVRVPEELAVVGFDDIPVARYLTPALSSVQVDISGLGGRAAQLLIEAVRARNKHPRRQEVWPTRLSVRSSCGANAPRGGSAARHGGAAASVAAGA